MQGTFIVSLPIYNTKIDYRNSINRDVVLKKEARGIKDDGIRVTDIISWDNVMGKKVRSFDGEDIGKVENVNTYSIEVKDGLLAK